MKFLTTSVPAALTREMFATIDSSSAISSAAIGSSRPVLRQRTRGSAASAQNQQANTRPMTIRYGSSSIGRLPPTV